MFSGGSRRIPRGREESEIGDWEECVRSGELGKCKEERKEGRKESARNRELLLVSGRRTKREKLVHLPQ